MKNKDDDHICIWMAGMSIGERSFQSAKKIKECIFSFSGLCFVLFRSRTGIGRSALLYRIIEPSLHLACSLFLCVNGMLAFGHTQGRNAMPVKVLAFLDDHNYAGNRKVMPSERVL